MKLRQQVLVVEPDLAVARAVQDALRRKGFEVCAAEKASDVLRATHPPGDVLVADVTLPDMTGAELRRALLARPDRAELPLLLIQPIITSRKRLRLFVDPDLYLSEPIDLSELPRRVSAAARPRASRIIGEVFESGALLVDTGAHRVHAGDREITLTALEFRLLVTFIATPDRVLTREHLLREAWGVRAHADTRTVDTNVKRLRQKLGTAAATIETIRNVGYRFRRPVEANGARVSGVRPKRDHAETSTSIPAPAPASSATGTSPNGHAS